MIILKISEWFAETPKLILKKAINCKGYKVFKYPVVKKNFLTGINISFRL
jgi:phage-related protein